MTYETFRDMGLAYAVANPMGEAWSWRKVKRKSDRDDALKLARMAALGELPTVPMPSKAAREYRALVQYRDRLVGRRTAAQNPILYRFLLNKWYFDEIYDFVFVRGAKALGRFLWKQGDGAVIDRLGPDGISARVVDITRGVVRLQTGYVYHYAFVMLVGVAAIISWYLLTGAGAH